MLATLKLYGRLTLKAARHALRAWPLALVLLLYVEVMRRMTVVLSSLGMIGGFIAGFAIAALVSSYLHLLSSAVAGRRLTLADLPGSFAARFWDVVSVLFALWIIGLGVGMLTAGMGPKAQIVGALVSLAMAVFFNPVPELIYQGSSRSFALLRDSARFVSAHWPEWLAPNIVVAAGLLAPTGLLHGSSMGARVLTMQAVFSLEGLTLIIAAIPAWLAPAMLLFIHYAMVFRGLLFQELTAPGGGLTDRQRAIRDAWGRR